MGKLQRLLLSAAQELTTEHLRRHPVFSCRWSDLTVLLSGSATTEYADEYSGIDLIVVSDDAQIAAIRDELPQHGGQLVEDNLYTLYFGPRRLKLSFFTWGEVGRALEVYDDFAMAVFPKAPVLHDPQGRWQEVVDEDLTIPEEVLQAKILQRCRRLRRRQAAIAWNLRRGQPYALLGNLNSFLAHALAVCFYLDGEAPTGRNWIFQGALKKPAGRRLRPHLFELFSSLNDLATLGGSFHIRHNRIYRLVVAIHDSLTAAVLDAGFELDREAIREAQDGPLAGAVLQEPGPEGAT